MWKCKLLHIIGNRHGLRTGYRDGAKGRQTRVLEVGRAAPALDSGARPRNSSVAARSNDGCSLPRHFQISVESIKIYSDAVRFRAIKTTQSEESRKATLMTKIFRVSICVLVLALFAAAQQQPDNTPIEPMEQTPIFRVNVVSRTTKAVNYRHRGGSTTVDIRGTDLMPER